MKKIKILTFVFALVYALSLSVYVFAAEQTITIFHTNDSHGRLVGDNSSIGIDRIAAINAANPNAILVDAGDTFHGLPFVTINRGMDAVELMNLAGYDLFTPGNHDFNYGYERLLELAQRASFDVLSANVKRGGATLFAPTAIREVEGVKIGFFGITTPGTYFLTNPTNVAGLEFADIAAASEAAIASLREEGADIIVALAHLGLYDERNPSTSNYLANAVSGIDLIIDGHSHTQLDSGYMINDVLIASAGDYMRFLGEVTLTFDSEEGVLTGRAARLIGHAEAMEFEPVPAVSARIAAILEEQDEVLNEVVTAIGTTLISDRAPGVRTQEMPLGNLVADALRAGTSADVAIINGGGLRADLIAGEITRGDIIAVLPFGNYGVTMMVSPNQLRLALENGVSAAPDESGRFPQISGFSFTFDVNRPAGSRVTSIVLGGEELDITNTNPSILLATNNFMAVGGDEYTVFADIAAENEFSALDELLLDFMRDNADLDYSAAEGRIVMVEGYYVPAVAYEVEKAEEAEEAEEVEEVTAEPVEAAEPVQEPAPVTVAVTVAPADARQVQVVNAWFLNVRAGAGVEHNPVGVLARGDVVDVLETRFGWMLIVSGGLQGWSYSGFLAAVE